MDLEIKTTFVVYADVIVQQAMISNLYESVALIDPLYLLTN